MNPDNTRFPDFKSDSRSASSGPIEPGRDLTLPSNPTAARSYEADRSGLILFLGILSLFMCGPVGLAAWIMACSDLRKIRKGLLSPEKTGILKVGRALGIIGTVIFVSVIVSGAFMLQKQFGDLPGIFKYTPLAADQMISPVNGLGKEGTVIRIIRTAERILKEDVNHNRRPGEHQRRIHIYRHSRIFQELAYRYAAPSGRRELDHATRRRDICQEIRRTANNIALTVASLRSFPQMHSLC